MKQRIQDLSNIIQLQQEIVTSNLPLDDLMRLICQKTQEITDATGAVVEIAENDEMVYRACTGSLAGSLGLRLKIATSLSGMSVTKNEVLYCRDSESDERVNREACRKVGARSMICVPLTHRGKSVGVLKVVSTEPEKFADRAVDHLCLIAGLLSATMAQARAHEDIAKSEKDSREATRAKSEFLANMSHEIRTPLNGIMGMADLLLETELAEAQKNYVQLLKNSADNLLMIINDILDFSKIEARKLSIENIDFELRPAIEDIRNLLDVVAEKKGLRILSHVRSDVPKTVNGDPFRLRQVIMNLVSNAIKFTTEGLIQINVFTTPTGVRFEIIDSGIGIPAESVGNLFAPFTQVDASTTRKFGGTGLGLSISKQLVEIMNGSIGVESRQGVGSTFWIILPLPEAQVHLSNEKLQDQDAEETHLRILVAEDNNVNALIAKAILEKLGHTVNVVGNGKEAISALNIAPYDVVLMDCQMPEMDGFQATHEIRNSSASWKKIPIMAMTANAMTGDREKCLAAGMDDYTSKPIQKNDLRAALRRLKK